MAMVLTYFFLSVNKRQRNVCRVAWSSLTKHAINGEQEVDWSENENIAGDLESLSAGRIDFLLFMAALFNIIRKQKRKKKNITMF